MPGVDTLATDSVSTVFSSPILWRHQRLRQCSDIVANLRMYGFCYIYVCVCVCVYTYI